MRATQNRRGTTTILVGALAIVLVVILMLVCLGLVGQSVTVVMVPERADKRTSKPRSPRVHRPTVTASGGVPPATLQVVTAVAERLGSRLFQCAVPGPVHEGWRYPIRGSGTTSFFLIKDPIPDTGLVKSVFNEHEGVGWRVRLKPDGSCTLEQTNEPVCTSILFEASTTQRERLPAPNIQVDVCGLTKMTDANGLVEVCGVFPPACDVHAEANFGGVACGTLEGGDVVTVRSEMTAKYEPRSRPATERVLLLCGEHRRPFEPVWQPGGAVPESVKDTLDEFELSALYEENEAMMEQLPAVGMAFWTTPLELTEALEAIVNDSSLDASVRAEARLDLLQALQTREDDYLLWGGDPNDLPEGVGVPSP